MSFESDLEALRAAPLESPMQQMRIRHQRRMGSSTLLVHILSSDRTHYDLFVALYDLGAVRRSKPVVVVEMDPLADLEAVEQRAIVTVRGWPSVGRAVMLDLNGTLIEPVYPCTSPIFRPMRFR